MLMTLTYVIAVLNGFACTSYNPYVCNGETARKLNKTLMKMWKVEILC
jgi:hypothetical protein